WRAGVTLAHAEQKSNTQAREMVEKGRDILRQLKQRTGLTAQQQQWLDGGDADLRAMQGTGQGGKRPRKTETASSFWCLPAEQRRYADRSLIASKTSALASARGFGPRLPLP